MLLIGWHKPDAMTTEGNSRSVRGVLGLGTFSHGDHFQLLFCDDGERMPIALIRVFCIHSVTSIWYIWGVIWRQNFITLSCGPCSIKVSITWHWSEFEQQLPPPPGKLLEFLWKRLSFCVFVVDIWISYFRGFLCQSLFTGIDLSCSKCLWLFWRFVILENMISMPMMMRGNKIRCEENYVR